MLNNAVCFTKTTSTAMAIFWGAVLVFSGACSDETPVRNEKRAAAVEVAEVRPDTFERRVSGIGTLKANQSVRITTEAEGTVEQILFREGQTVASGELLVVIRGEKLRRQLAAAKASLRGAEADLEYAGRTYERFKRLRQEKTASVEDYERERAGYHSAQARVDQLQADIALIEEQLEDTRIKAPFSGVLSSRFIDIGDLVRPGDVLVQLFSIDIEISFALPERYIGDVAYGQSVEILVDAYPEKKFNAGITFISPDINEVTRNFTVKAYLENEDRLLKPGGFATAVVRLETRKDVPAVPENALIGTPSGYVVFVVEDGAAYERKVEAGLRVPGMVQIMEGVSVGEKVVAAGHMALRDGDSVQVIDNQNLN